MRSGRDILGEYGKDISHPQAPRATSGGCTDAKPLNYREPVGPIGLGNRGPGLGGTNHGNAHCPVASGTSGSPGNGGTPHRGGSQRG